MHGQCTLEACFQTCTATQGRASVQEAEIVLDLFRALRLTEEQQQTAAEAWRGWVRIREALDRSVADALQPLEGLLDVADLMLDATNPFSHTVHSIESCGWLGTGADHHGGAPAADALLGPPISSDGAAVEAGDVGALEPAAGVDGPGGGADVALRGDRICLCMSCASIMAKRMAGVSAGVTADARRSVAALSGVHRRDGEVAVEQLRAICMPGSIFTPEQYAQQTALVLQQGALMDWLWLCKVAAAELQHREVFENLDQQCSSV